MAGRVYCETAPSEQWLLPGFFLQGIVCPNQSLSYCEGQIAWLASTHLRWQQFLHEKNPLDEIATISTQKYRILKATVQRRL